MPGALDGPEYPVEAAASGAWTVAQLYDRLRGVLQAGVPTPLWVTGEVAKTSERDGRLDLELVDPGGPGRSRPLLSCVVWPEQWAGLRARLENAGLALGPGMRLSVCGSVRLWPAASRVQFAVSDINVEELLGALALRRQALVRELKASGLYDANRRLAPPDLPLRIGVVGGRGTQGTRDFVEKLSASPFAFELVTAEATFEGAGAERSISAALQALTAAHHRTAISLDLIVVVRGGGARAALAPFDSESVVRALVNSPVPVWTGIGHDADRTLADEVAHRAWRTPTECAEAVLRTVGDAWLATASAVGKVAQAVGRLREDARRHLEEAERRASSGVRRAVERERLRLDHELERIERAGRVVRDRERAGVADRLARGERAARQVLARAAVALEACDRTLSALNPKSTLRRGYAIVRDREGRAVRDPHVLRPRDPLSIEVAQGAFPARVAGGEVGLSGPVRRSRRNAAEARGGAERTTESWMPGPTLFDDGVVRPSPTHVAAPPCSDGVGRPSSPQVPAEPSRPSPSSEPTAASGHDECRSVVPGSTTSGPAAVRTERGPETGEMGEGGVDGD